jgi:hypothetical protein
LSSHANAEPFYHFPTEVTLADSYASAPLPLDEMTAATNLFPQTLHAPASLELPLPYDNTLTMNSGLDFFAMANYNLQMTRNDDNNDDPTNVDYHSSDLIFDQFDATFGSLDGAY